MKRRTEKNPILDMKERTPTIKRGIPSKKRLWNLEPRKKEEDKYREENNHEIEQKLAKVFEGLVFEEAKESRPPGWRAAGTGLLFIFRAGGFKPILGKRGSYPERRTPVYLAKKTTKRGSTIPRCRGQRSLPFFLTQRRRYSGRKIPRGRGERPTTNQLGVGKKLIFSAALGKGWFKTTKGDSTTKRRGEEIHVPGGLLKKKTPGRKIIGGTRFQKTCLHGENRENREKGEGAKNASRGGTT